VIGYVKQRESELESIKADHIINAQKAWNEYNDFACEDKAYSVNIFYAMVMSFLATIYNATPEYSWIGLDDN
jgi:hypothetical protein